MKLISDFKYLLKMALFEIWSFRQYFSKHPNGLFIKTNTMEAVIQITNDNLDRLETIFYTNLLFLKSLKKETLQLNEYKGRLNFNFVTFQIECLFEEDFENIDYKNIQLEF